MDSQRTYQKWLEEPTLSDEARAELLTIADDPAEIEERFYRSLEKALGLPAIQPNPGVFRVLA